MTTRRSVKVMTVELCPDCTDDQRGSKVIDMKDLCPACSLAVVARWC